MNIFKNLQIKILAMVSALLLWLFVVGVENYVYLYPTNLPVKIMNLGQNVSVANGLPSVKVHYKASDDFAGANVNANEFEFFVDAENLNEGDYNLDVNYISKNPKITIVSVEPAKIELNLEAQASKEIKLKAEISGIPGKDYEVKDLKLSQDNIKISGAASVLAKITNMTIKIALDGTETADFSRKITVEAPGEWNLSGKTVSFDPSVIQADIQVRKTAKSEDLLTNPLTNSSGTGNISPVDTSNLKKKTLMAEIVVNAEMKSAVKELLPENILVTVEGDASEVDKLNSNSIKLNLQKDVIDKGIYNVNQADIVLPSEVKIKIVEFSPATVLVKF